MSDFTSFLKPEEGLTAQKSVNPSSFLHPSSARPRQVFLKSTSNRLFFRVATRYYKIHSATSFLVWNPLSIGIPTIVACSRKAYRHFFLFPHILASSHWLATFSMAVHIGLASFGIGPDINFLTVGLPFSPHFLSGFYLSEVLHNEFACLT